MLLSSGRHPNDVGGGLSGACNCWRIQVAVVVAASVMASCWVRLDWGGGLKEWSAPGMTWRVERGVGAVPEGWFDTVRRRRRPGSPRTD